MANAMKEELIEKTNHLKEQGVGPMQGVPLPAPESDREIRLLTREVYYDKLAVKERFIRINLKGDGRWKSCLTGNTG